MTIVDFLCEVHIDCAGNRPLFLYGCSFKGPLWLVVKFAAHGSLLDFLAKYRQPEYENTSNQTPAAPLTEKEKLKFAYDISKGMAHLSKKKVSVVVTRH